MCADGFAAVQPDRPERLASAAIRLAKLKITSSRAADRGLALTQGQVARTSWKRLAPWSPDYGKWRCRPSATASFRRKPIVRSRKPASTRGSRAGTFRRLRDAHQHAGRDRRRARPRVRLKRRDFLHQSGDPELDDRHAPAAGAGRGLGQQPRRAPRVPLRSPTQGGSGRYVDADFCSTASGASPAASTLPYGKTCRCSSPK